MNSTRAAVGRAIAISVVCATSAPAVGAQQAGETVIRAAAVLDGRGHRLTNAAIVVRNGSISSVVQGAAASAAVQDATVVFDLGGATVLPGLVDSHVHATQYINAAGRLHTGSDADTPSETALAVARNLRRMLESGVTTAQSMGSSDDAAFRAAIHHGGIAGPRLLTTLDPITNAQLTPDSLRALVRRRNAEGADAIKIFASRSIREGGASTMSAEQLGALCGEARLLGLRTLVHAHSEDSIRLATLAGCTQIEHGIFATPAVLELMAEHGTYFDPQCGLIFQNYLDNRAAYQGIGNFNDEGFDAMVRAKPMAAKVIARASTIPGLKLVWGTDAVAGAHGREVEDLICRVRDGGQPAMDAIVSATAVAAQALRLGAEIGVIAPGYRADIIATDGDPSVEIEALRRVTFVMQDGRVVKVERGRARVR